VLCCAVLCCAVLCCAGSLRSSWWLLIKAGQVCSEELGQMHAGVVGELFELGSAGEAVREDHGAYSCSADGGHRAPQRRRNLVGDGASSAHRRAVPLLAVHQTLMVSSLACQLLQTASARVRRPRRRRHSALIPLARSTASEKLRSATRFSRIDRAFATLGAHVATRHGMRWPPRCRRGCVT